MKKKNKGFSLMEMLVVVAIIAVLIGIAIPVLGGRVKEARQRNDNENLKNLCATAVSEYLLDKKTGEAKYSSGTAEADYDGKTLFEGSVSAWKKGDAIGVKVNTVNGTAIVTAVGKTG